MSEAPRVSFSGPDEYYADSLRIGVNTYGVILQFGITTDGAPGEARTQAIVRMSPQHALVMYQLMKKNLRAYQQAVGPISLPEQLFTELDIEREV